MIPDFLYGTAWKEDRTAELTELALRSGFRGIDTANQRRHYFEAGVGQGLAAAYRAGIVSREDLFLHQPRRVAGSQAEFGWKPGADRIELQAAVPRGRRGARGPFRHGVQQAVRRGALRAEVDQSGD